MSANDWEFERHDWGQFEAYGDVESIPVALGAVLRGESESEWRSALQRLEAIASDCGVPSSATPAVVGCLASAALRVDQRRREAIVSTLEELTCGRGREIYDDQQQVWMDESVRELILSFDYWVQILEDGSLEEVKDCMALLAYCAELQRWLADRAAYYLARAVGRFPVLAEEARALGKYFRHDG